MKLQGNTEETKKRMITMGKGGSSPAKPAGVSPSTVRHIPAGRAAGTYTAGKTGPALPRGVDRLFHEYKGEGGNDGEGT